MYEFNIKTINREGFKFVAQDTKVVGGKVVYLYKTENKDEIKVLDSLEFVKKSK